MEPVVGWQPLPSHHKAAKKVERIDPQPPTTRLAHPPPTNCAVKEVTANIRMWVKKEKERNFKGDKQVVVFVWNVCVSVLEGEGGQH